MTKGFGGGAGGGGAFGGGSGGAFGAGSAGFWGGTQSGRGAQAGPGRDKRANHRHHQIGEDLLASDLYGKKKRHPHQQHQQQMQQQPGYGLPGTSPPFSFGGRLSFPGTRPPRNGPAPFSDQPKPRPPLAAKSEPAVEVVFPNVDTKTNVTAFLQLVEGLNERPQAPYGLHPAMAAHATDGLHVQVAHKGIAVAVMRACSRRKGNDSRLHGVFLETVLLGQQEAAFRAFLEPRFTLQTQFLDLSSLPTSDPLLAGIGLRPDFSTRTFTDKVVSFVAKHIPNLTSLSLAGNKLRNLDALAAFARAVGRLRNVNLANNAISDVYEFSRLKLLPHMAELVVTGNPFCKADLSHICQLTEAFPSLKLVDGVSVEDRPIGIPPSATSCQDKPDVLQLTENFVTSFINCYDNERGKLATFYREKKAGNCVFRMFSDADDPAAGQYSESVSSSPTKSLGRGPPPIPGPVVRAQAALPGIRHLPGLKQEAWLADNFLYVFVRGQFVDTGSNKTCQFKRSFHLSQPSAGSAAHNAGFPVVIVKDYWQILPSQGSATGSGTPTPALASVPVPGMFAPPAASASMGPAEVAMAPQEATMAVDDAASEQSRKCQMFATETRLKPEFAKQCLEMAGWDLNQAVVVFQQHREGLSAEHFQ